MPGKTSVNISPEIKEAVKRHIYPFYDIYEWASQAMEMKMKTNPDCSVYFGDQSVCKGPYSIVMVDQEVHARVSDYCSTNKI